MRILEPAGMGLVVALGGAAGPALHGSNVWADIRSPQHHPDTWQGILPVEAIEPSGYPEEPAPAPRSSTGGGSPSTETLAMQLAALRTEVQEMREAHRRDQQHIGELRTRIRDLELEMADLLARDDGAEVVTNPHYAWIEEHLDELRRHPDMWVAIDPERGIVAEAGDGDQLADQLAALPPEEQARLLAVDTRLYT